MALSESASCRILTVSPSLNLIASLVHQIQKLDGPAKTIENGGQIPWTISNKYYNAPVHFLAHKIKGLAPYLFQGVPAVIFVWPKGQAYRHHILRLTQDLTGSDPEVSLAVMLPPSADLQDDPEEHPEDVAVMDEFLSSKGFEFIDATISNDEQDRNYISSFPRILDALSTIMWPSMQSSASSQPLRTRNYAFLDLDESSDSFDISDDEFVVKRPSIGPAGQSRAQKQMTELAKWLEEDAEEEMRQRKADPWRNQTDDGLAQSPTEIEFQLDGNRMKFDDDFTSFVSAPPLPSSSTLSVDPTGLTSSFAGSLYHSLGSQSDLGVNEEDEDQDYLPSEEEVLKTAGEIFGTTDLPETFQFDDEDGQSAPFDLSRVFDALQDMKAEIANIDDEHERRKAAAKVALGLVYGMELEQTRTQ